MKKIFPILGLAILISAAIITLAITKEAVKDPVCGMEVDPATATIKMDSPHGAIYFCSQTCMDKFQANPSAYMKAAKSEKAAKAGCEGCDKTKATATTAKAAGCTGCEGKAKDAATKTSAAGSGCPMGGQKAMEAASSTTSTEAMACTGECGKTKVAAINEFHKLMPDMETGGVAKIKANVAAMVSRKAAVMEAKCPEGMCPEGFTALRTTFSQKLDALVEVAKSGNDEAIRPAFNEMHRAYEAMDQAAR
jgi:YHS domain-containing protein